MATSSPLLPPSSFDPAVHLHSEANNPVIRSSHADSDDLEALNLQAQEAIAQKTREGVVIQHRAWKLTETFRSDEDYNQGEL